MEGFSLCYSVSELFGMNLKETDCAFSANTLTSVPLFILSPAADTHNSPSGERAAHKLLSANGTKIHSELHD